MLGGLRITGVAVSLNTQEVVPVKGFLRFVLTNGRGVEHKAGVKGS